MEKEIKKPELRINKRDSYTIKIQYRKKLEQVKDKEKIELTVEESAFLGFASSLIINSTRGSYKVKPSEKEVTFTPDTTRAETYSYVELYDLGRFKFDPFKDTVNVHKLTDQQFTDLYFNNSLKHTPFKEKKEHALNAILTTVIEEILENNRIYPKDIYNKLELCKRRKNRQNYLNNF